MLYVGIAILVIGIAFAIGTYAYYSITITGTATGQVLAYTCTGNNTTNFTLESFTNAYPGYSATRTISLNASIYTEATINVSSYTNMGESGQAHENLAIYSDESHTKKMSNGVNTITTTITPGTATDVPIYIYWPYGSSAETYSSAVPSATITITCNQGVAPTTAAAVLGASSDLVEVAGAKRYTGAAANNYVSFNDGELWRIIGIYDGKLKIVKATALTDLTMEQRRYNNNSSDGNAWEGSDLQEYLTNTYYPTLSATARGMIEENATWLVGAGAYGATAEALYTGASATTYQGEIGLIAAYEYLYAAGDSSCYTKTSGSSQEFVTAGCQNNDWLKPSWGEWTLSPDSDSSDVVLLVDSNGYVYNIYVGNAYGVRPAVYLQSSVKIMSGQGTEQQPYVLG